MDMVSQGFDWRVYLRHRSRRSPGGSDSGRICSHLWARGAFSRLDVTVGHADAESNVRWNVRAGLGVAFAAPAARAEAPAAKTGAGVYADNLPRPAREL